MMRIPPLLHSEYALPNVLGRVNAAPLRQVLPPFPPGPLESINTNPQIVKVVIPRLGGLLLNPGGNYSLFFCVGYDAVPWCCELWCVLSVMGSVYQETYI